MSPPLFSIVTPVLNRADMVADAIASVRAQPSHEFEHIVVDGGSTDGTLDALARHAHLHVIQAPGSTIYQALNLAIRRARGMLIVHLNSDDLLVEGALRKVLDAYELSGRRAEAIRGRACHFAEDSGRRIPLDHLDRAFPLQLAPVDLMRGSPGINACIITAGTYRRIGLYDERWRIASDREWLLRAWLAGLRIRTIEAPVYAYRTHPGSLTNRAATTASARWLEENLQIIREYLRRPGLPPAFRTELLEWHAKEVMRMVVATDRSASGSSLSGLTAGAFATDPIWLVRAIRQMPAIAHSRLQHRLSASRASKSTEHAPG